jgi:hypothetical protein
MFLGHSAVETITAGNALVAQLCASIPRSVMYIADGICLSSAVESFIRAKG